MAQAETKKVDWANLRKAVAYARRLWPLIRPQWPQLILVILGMALFAGGYAARIFVLGKFLNVMNRHNRDAVTDEVALALLQEVAPLAGILFVGAVGMAVGTYLKQYYQGYLRSSTIMNLQRHIVDRVLKQPMSFFNTERKGALMSRMTTNARSAGQLVQIMLDVVLAQPLIMIGVVSVLLYFSPMLTLMTFVVFPIVLGPVLLFAGKIRSATRKKYKKLEASGNFFHQMLDGIRVVKGYRLEDSQREEFRRVSQDVFTRERKVARYKGSARFGVEFTYNTLLALGLFGVGFVMTADWFRDSGGLVLFVTYFAGLIFLYDPARKLGHSVNEIQESTAGLDRVFELMDREPEIQDKPGAIEAPHEFSKIEFDAVGFEYIENHPVLSDIHIAVRRGEMVALVGQSGHGKSTLMDLIPRFYDPTEGAIRVDGTDLRDFRQESWLRNIAIVNQDTFLFNNSVRDNIRAGRPDATEDEIIQAAKAAHIWAEIQEMPQGLDTKLGDRGVTISGGQRQRIAIARAFLRKSPILLLDEATSSLDTQSEREVQKALDELIEECTVFAVAHRLSTVRNADLILVLNEGRIIERGTHDQLMQLDGAYAAAYRLQHGSETEPGAEQPAHSESANA